jgi:hypothetical protein
MDEIDEMAERIRKAAIIFLPRPEDPRAACMPLILKIRAGIDGACYT